MPFLLRVELPDVPGSLGRLAGAIGEAGGDIEAIEIVEKGHDGVAVDDVLLETAPGAMPDSIVSACNALDGVRVLWISRYAAGGNVFLDLEAIEDLTAHPIEALDRLVDLLPAVFRSDWGARVGRDAGVLHSTGGAPEHVPWAKLDGADRLEVEDEQPLLAARPARRRRDRRHRPPRRPGLPRLRARPPRPPRRRWRCRSPATARRRRLTHVDRSRHRADPGDEHRAEDARAERDGVHREVADREPVAVRSRPRRRIARRPAGSRWPGSARTPAAARWRC